MFGLGAVTRIYVATGHTDMRLSFDGLHSLVIGQIKQSPQSGRIAPGKSILFRNTYR